MRIIGGKYKGHLLKTFSGRTIRPTSEKVREAIFNILGSEIEAAEVLELFAGTGALGFEALSRGAKMVTMVEKDRRALKIIRENTRILGFRDSVQIISRDYRSALRQIGGEDSEYHLVFADPPYRLLGGKGGIEKLLSLVDSSVSLTPDALIVVEHFLKIDFPSGPPGWIQVKRKQYGQTGVSIFQRQN